MKMRTSTVVYLRSVRKAFQLLPEATTFTTFADLQRLLLPKEQEVMCSLQVDLEASNGIWVIETSSLRCNRQIRRYASRFFMSGLLGHQKQTEHSSCPALANTGKGQHRQLHGTR